MNYLGHAFLSFGDPGILTGNLIGDHVKGKLALEHFPEQIRNGIMLHRKIDSFTDEHAATKRGRLWFREDYGLYSGAIMDSLYDHFLANDPKQFASEKDLLAFTLETYEKAETNAAYFPEVFKGYFGHMKEYNWLYSYRTLQGIQRSLGGVARRANYMPPPEKAYEIFISQYYQLAQCYYELIDEVVAYVKVELTR